MKTVYKPEIKPIQADLSEYDILAIGTPTWWYTMAPAIRTFLENECFSGKAVIPFMTHAGWPGHGVKDMKNILKDATIENEMQIQFDEEGKDKLTTPIAEIERWIQNTREMIRD